MKRKLLYCVGAELPSQHASAVHAYQMTSALSKKFDVLFLAKFTAEKEEIVNIYGKKNNSLFLKGRPWAVVRAVKLLYFMSRVDIVYSRWYYSLFALFFFKKEFYFEFHALPYGLIARLSVTFLNRVICNRNIRIVCISQQLKDDLIRKYGGGFCKAIVAHDGADDTSVLDSTFHSSDQYDVGYVGSLKPGKGVERLISIANLMPDIRFVVYGGTKLEIEQLYSLVDHNNVIFKGFVPASEIAHSYSTFRIGLLPNYPNVFIGGNDIGRWTSPLKLFEYMAAKKAIVLTDLPVFREVIKENETGLFCDSDDLECWVSSIRILLNDIDLYRKLTDSAYESFKNEYSWDARVRNVLGV